MSTYIGFDPGGYEGRGSFGWAVVSGKGRPLRIVGRGTANHAQGAFDAAIASAGSAKINAVGIDAPLFWVPAGDRCADQIVRRAITRVGSPGGTVSAVNALRGACLIQGMLVAMMCQELLANEIPITESHPKALLWLLGKATPRRLPNEITIADLRDYVVEDTVREAIDHERDAVLGAFTAFAMHSRLPGWRDLYSSEIKPVTPLNPLPGYWMPI